MATFVLVHGAWGGGWYWRPVARRLRAQGHEVFTPTMTGLGERSHLLSAAVNLGTHIDDIANVFRYEQLENAVLCGHSYGGMVVTGVADRLASKIASLVYLDAFLPENGQRLLDLVGQLPGPGLAPGSITVPPPPPGAFAPPGAEPVPQDPRLGPHPLAAFLQPITLANPQPTVPKRSYIYAANWGPSPFTQFYEKTRQDPSWVVHSMPCGHVVPLEMPDELAALLLTFAP